jgi:thiamine biosynthesis lipoprotein
MGTRCRIVVYAPSEAPAAAACAGAFARVAEIELALSDYNPASEASRLVAAEPGIWHPVSSDLARALRLSQQVFQTSNGAFDPSLGPLTKLWRRTRRDGVLPDAGVLAEARARSGFSMFEIDPELDRIRFSRPGLGLDFGGIGKGLAADEALQILEEAGFRAALIDFGGGLVAGDAPPGQKAWEVEVRNGLGGVRLMTLANAAVATSGDVEQFVEIAGSRYAHIVDPATGLGLTRRTAATVVAQSGWLADALATAACVLGSDGVGELSAAYPDARIEVTTAAPH